MNPIALREPEARAFEDDWRRHRGFIHRYALKLTRNANDAEDLVQETARKAWTAYGSFNSQARFSTWLITICRNTWRDELKRRGRRVSAVSYDEPAGDDIEYSDVFPDSEPSILEHLADEAGALAIIDQMRHIPFFETMILYVHDMTYEEIAAKTGAPMGTVKSRINRFKKAAQAAGIGRMEA